MTEDDMNTGGRPLQFQSFAAMVAGVSNLLRTGKISEADWRNAVKQSTGVEAGARVLADTMSFAAACIRADKADILIPLSDTSAATVVHLKLNKDAEATPEMQAMAEAMGEGGKPAPEMLNEVSMTLMVIGNQEGIAPLMACNLAKVCAEYLETPEGFQAGVDAFSKDVGAASALVVRSDTDGKNAEAFPHKMGRRFH